MKIVALSFPGFALKPRHPRKAQTLVEYALIICMMTILGVAIYSLLNGQIERIFSVMANNLDTAQASL